jgi:urease accessory protein UreF
VVIAATEKELAKKAARFLKAEMKRAGVTYAQLAEKLKEHGLEETEASITSKLARGTFAATFFIAVVAALEMDGVNLTDL